MSTEEFNLQRAACHIDERLMAKCERIYCDMEKSRTSDNMAKVALVRCFSYEQAEVDDAVNKAAEWKRFFPTVKRQGGW